MNHWRLAFRLGVMVYHGYVQKYGCPPHGQWSMMQCIGTYVRCRGIITLGYHGMVRWYSGISTKPTISQIKIIIHFYPLPPSPHLSLVIRNRVKIIKNYRVRKRGGDCYSKKWLLCWAHLIPCALSQRWAFLIYDTRMLRGSTFVFTDPEPRNFCFCWNC